MIITQAPTRPRAQRTTNGVRMIAGVVAAIGGRWLWRLWWPLALWLFVAGATRLWLATGPRTFDGTPITSSMTPGATLLLACPVAVVLLWAWGARFALGLGLPRGAVYVAAAVSSMTLPALNELLGATATVWEYRLVGRYGLRVFLGEGSNTLGTDDSVLNIATTVMAIYGMPLLAVLAGTCAGYLGRGIVGALFGIVCGALLYPVGIALWGPVATVVSPVIALAEPWSDVFCGLASTGLASLGMLTLGWFLYRSARA